MSDSKKNPPLPPDDFSKTMPNVPQADDLGSSDWEKTNYHSKFSPQPPADDWGKTVANIKPSNNEEPDFNKTYLPSAQNPKNPDWGLTEPNIRVPHDDFGAKDYDDRGGYDERAGYGATSPFIHLPDAERAKYQKLPPTPTEQRAEQKKEEAKKGVPGWFWAVAGIMAMFFFAVILLLLVWIFFMKPTGFDVIVRNHKPNSIYFVDEQRWGVTAGDGSVKLPSLGAGSRQIRIEHANFVCEPLNIQGRDGDVKEVSAICSEKAPPPRRDECQEIKKGEFEKAERCANQALDNLKEPFTAEDVTKALNLYIINFASGKFDIPPKNMAFLQKAAGYIQKLPAATVIEVGGHTDSDGADRDNQILSEKRAKAVRNALVGFGVSPNMLTEKGYGEMSPKATNNTEDGKFQNRRIEYKVLQR